MTTDTTSKIAALKDHCRKATGIGGRLFQTRGIDALPFRRDSETQSG